MSATGQAAAAGGDGGVQGGEAAQGAQGFDAAALQAQLQQTAGGVDDLRQQFGQFLESAPWQAPEPQAEEPGIDLSFLDQGLYDPAVGDSEREAFQSQFQQQINGLVQQQLQQALSPLQEQQQEMVRQQQARDLVAEHPELQDREVAEGVVRTAQQTAQDMGMPDLGNNPLFWKLVHQASRAVNTANAEQGGDGSPQAAHLEGGGGAGPAGGQQVDIADQILGSRKGGSVLPY